MHFPLSFLSVDLDEPFNKAIKESKKNIVLVEEFIQMTHDFMIGGDAFIFEGKVKFMGLLNSHRHSIKHPFIPTGTSWPVVINDKQIIEITGIVQKIVDKLGIRMGGLNLEFMYDKRGDLYIIEIAPRNGGNMIPQLLFHATGVDIIAALVEASVGNVDIDLDVKIKKSYYSTYVIHSDRNGILKEVRYKTEIKEKIIHEYLEVKKGEEVFEFDNAKKSIGIIILKFNDFNEEQYLLKNINSYVEVLLE